MIAFLLRSELGEERPITEWIQRDHAEPGSDSGIGNVFKLATQETYPQPLV